MGLWQPDAWNAHGRPQTTAGSERVVHPTTACALRNGLCTAGRFLASMMLQRTGQPRTSSMRMRKRASRVSCRLNLRIMPVRTIRANASTLRGRPSVMSVTAKCEGAGTLQSGPLGGSQVSAWLNASARMHACSCKLQVASPARAKMSNLHSSTCSKRLDSASGGLCAILTSQPPCCAAVCDHQTQAEAK